MKFQMDVCVCGTYIVLNTNFVSWSTRVPIKKIMTMAEVIMISCYMNVSVSKYTGMEIVTE